MTTQCCTPAAQETCCALESKAECCGTVEGEAATEAPSSCGCR
ncbi:hypothetical protein [Nonomuraea dietziae]|uniref:Uncharacterized protein n=1 Tax=Nonomuraea dietziae TaxID=65515 RepID=A0A7W5V5S7_9ACTN|nr:hypothetical protein [Nonomuraea dietziae]MBB3726064.1 hypothetical protein [Nonomuraea dietziae]